MYDKETALVLFSGGQDSTTCLAWALARFAAVETIGFDYGQRHHVEMECRERILARLRREFPEWAAKLGQDHVIDLSVLGAMQVYLQDGDRVAREGFFIGYTPVVWLTVLLSASGDYRWLSDDEEEGMVLWHAFTPTQPLDPNGVRQGQKRGRTPLVHMTGRFQFGGRSQKFIGSGLLVLGQHEAQI